MEGKKSFLLYCDQIGLFKKLPDEQAGKLIKIIFDYVNDLNPEINDVLLDVAFESIKLQLKRDLMTWNNIVERNRINGAKGGRPKKPKEPTGLIGKPRKPKKADSDTVTDSDTIDIYIHPLNKFIFKSLHNVSKLDGQPTPEQCDWLIKTYGKKLVEDKLLSMENKKDLLKKYKSCYLTLQNWCKMAYQKA